MQVAELFERAKSATGSHTATAEALGVKPQRLNDWKSGYRPCPAEVQDRLLVLSQATDAEIAAHVVERAGMSRKAERMAGFIEAGFAGLLATVAAAGAALLGGHPGIASAIATMYTPTDYKRRLVNSGIPA